MHNEALREVMGTGTVNWDDYRYFLAVARTGQLSLAGRQLGVDHATVSRRIRALENTLRAQLFDRSPRGYALTVEGQDLVAVAEEMEVCAIRAPGMIGGQRDTISGKVRLGVPEGVCAYIVVEAAQKLCETYPRLEIDLVALPRTFSLSKREADIVIAVSRPKSGRLRVKKVSDYTLHLYGSSDYLNRFPEIQTIEDLRPLRGIAYVPDLIFDKELDYVPLISPTFQPSLTSTSVHVQLEATLNGAGVCILHDFMAERHPSLVKVLPQQISFTRSFWCVVYEDYAMLERIRVCAAAIVDHMRTRLRSQVSAQSGKAR